MAEMTTLDGLRAAAWDRLESAARDRSGPAHLMTLATGGPAGPSLRMLVLRDADREARTVGFWTNARSDKIADLARDPRAAALAWDPDALLQIRLSLHVTTAPGPAEVWDDLPEDARANYRIAPGPGSPLATPEDASAATAKRAAFRHLACHVTAMEVLHLAPDLHRRALYDDGGARWLMP